MTRTFRWIGLAALSFALTGCVAQEKYNALKLERDELASRVAQAEAEARADREKAGSLQKQLDALMAGLGGQQDLVSNLTRQNASLQAALEELNRKYAEALGRAGFPAGNPLPPDMNQALKDLAAQYPGVITYDAQRGIVKFSSDVTFASGSAELTPKAREVIGKFAEILNSPHAAKYEMLVAGHTDSQPVVNPATIRAGHKDNWYLSAHRAISVGQALMKGRVDPHRLGVVGYADERPVASNATAEGRALNRRVEVLILPATVHGGEEPVAPKAGEGSGLNKDTETAPAAPPSAPALNKQ